MRITRTIRWADTRRKISPILLSAILDTSVEVILDAESAEIAHFVEVLTGRKVVMTDSVDGTGGQLTDPPYRVQRHHHLGEDS